MFILLFDLNYLPVVNVSPLSVTVWTGRGSAPLCSLYTVRTFERALSLCLLIGIVEPVGVIVPIGQNIVFNPPSACVQTCRRHIWR